MSASITRLIEDRKYKSGFNFQYYIRFIDDDSILEILSDKPFLIAYLDNHPKYDQYVDFVTDKSPRLIKFVNKPNEAIQLKLIEKHIRLYHLIRNPTEQVINIVYDRLNAPDNDLSVEH